LNFFLLPPCTGVESGLNGVEINGQPSFPQNNGSQQWTTPAGNFSVPCGTSTPLPSNPTCYFPIAKTPDSYTDAYCLPVCPTPLLEYYKPFEIVQTVFGWISLASAIFILVVRLIDKRWRSYPRNLTTFMFLSSLIVSCAFVINSLNGFKSVVCQNSVTSSTYRDAACGFQAILLYIGALVGIQYWAAISIHSVLPLYLHKKASSESLFSTKTMILTHIVCWFLPIVGTIILIATDSIGSTGHTFCWIQADKDSDGIRTNYTKKWILFTVPVIFWLVVGLSCVAAAMVKIQQLREDAQARMRIRVLVFAAVFTLLFGWIIGYETYQTANVQEFKNGQLAWAKCAVAESRVCPAQGQINTVLYWMFDISIFIQGLLLLFLFGTSQATVKAVRTVGTSIGGFTSRASMGAHE